MSEVKMVIFGTCPVFGHFWTLGTSGQTWKQLLIILNHYIDRLDYFLDLSHSAQSPKNGSEVKMVIFGTCPVFGHFWTLGTSGQTLKELLIMLNHNIDRL